LGIGQCQGQKLESFLAEAGVALIAQAWPRTDGIAHGVGAQRPLPHRHRECPGQQAGEPGHDDDVGVAAGGGCGGSPPSPHHAGGPISASGTGRLPGLREQRALPSLAGHLVSTSEHLAHPLRTKFCCICNRTLSGPCNGADPLSVHEQCTVRRLHCNKEQVWAKSLAGQPFVAYATKGCPTLAEVQVRRPVDSCHCDGMGPAIYSPSQQ